MANLQDAINNAGLNNVKIQRLDRCFTSAKTNKKGVTTISFQTTQTDTGTLAYGNKPEDMVGFVLWIPRKDLPTS